VDCHGSEDQTASVEAAVGGNAHDEDTAVGCRRAYSPDGQRIVTAVPTDGQCGIRQRPEVLT